MGVPGPGVAEWGVALLAWAALAGLLGELVRTLTGRYLSLWRRPEPIERAVLDFYLGGAVLYLIAAVPGGFFLAPVVDLLPFAATAALIALAVHAARRPGWTDSLLAALAPVGRPAYLLAIASAVGLFVVELWVAGPIGTGNTYDSSLLTLYTANLLRHHSIGLSFEPYAPTGLLYPQGSVAWLGWAQLVFGLPPARTALLVTPLFLGLAPLAGFAFGRRIFGSEWAGLATALLLAWVGPGTRSFAFGSNDFVLAFPLVLLLAGEAVVWLRTPAPRWPDALAYGVLAGYSAAINPVGVEWLLLALPVAALLSRPRFGGRVRDWFASWAVAAAASLLAILPTLYVLGQGRSSPGLVPAATSAPGTPSGISASQFFGFLDPFLLGSGATELSPIAALKVELIVLLVVGLALLLLVPSDSEVGRYLRTFRPFVAGAAVILVALLAVFWAARSGFGPAVVLTDLSSSNELSQSLFALYGLIATVPFALAIEEAVRTVRRSPGPSEPVPAAPAPRPRARPPGSVTRTILPLVVALAIVVPGVVLTPTELASSLSETYHEFGNVTAADFDLLAYSGSHLPNGARVLVAPGSAGEFLPGYCPDIVLLYPMVPGFQSVNASYETLVRDLPNGTLGPADALALSELRAQYVVVTGNSSALWPAFSPRPFLADPGAYAEEFHEGDAYLFGVTG